MQKVYKLGQHEIQLEWDDHVFEPNLTTRKLANHVQIPIGASCLDLGCGIGPLSAFAALQGASRVLGVELQKAACDLAVRNISALGLQECVEIRHGHLYEPVASERFDVIINDVAGVASTVASLSPWYPETVKQAGPDGTDLTIEVLQNAKTHLVPGGTLYFPLLSLCAERKVHAVIQETFPNQLVIHAKYRVPFPSQLIKVLSLMSELQEQGVISFYQVGTRYF